MCNWRVIPYSVDDAAWNMALDEAILESFVAGDVPPTLRFYGWSEPAVTIGRLQPIDSVPKDWKGRIVRRPTGGRAVYHPDDLLTFSFVVGTNTLGSPVRESYKRVAMAVTRAMVSVGVPAEFCNDTTVPAAVRGIGNCFDLTLDYELAVEGKKVLGSAQVRRAGAVLQQNSIACPAHLCPDRQQLIDSIVREIGIEFGVSFSEGILSENELKITRNFTDKKYALESWNQLGGSVAL